MQAFMKLLVIFTVVCQTFADESTKASVSERPALYICPGLGTIKELEEDYPWWLAQLQEVVVYRSDLDRNALQVTIIEPLSIERLVPLRLQCKMWGGAIAVAAYMPIVDNKLWSNDTNFDGMSLEDALKVFKDEHDRLAASCAIDIAVYVEHILTGRENDLYLGFPNNALRNKALELASTETVLLMDGDFLPGPTSFVRALHSAPAVYSDIKTALSNHSVLVLNSIELNTSGLSDDDNVNLMTDVLRAHKTQIAEMLSSGLVKEFRPRCHRETNFRRWLTTDEMYTVKYENHVDFRHIRKAPGLYEPYILALRKSLPYFDERFRGYHHNKQVLFYILYRQQFNFVVHPEGFVLHYPHFDLQPRALTPVYATKRSIYFERIPAEYAKQGEEHYKPVRASKAAECTSLEQLDEEARAARVAALPLQWSLQTA